MVRRTFFNPVETEESRRVRETKRRLALAQMCQALRWNEDNPSDNPQKRAKKRPPVAADLFEMVYDDVEERHVLDYNQSASATSEECRSFHQYYEATVILFKERLIADFEECLSMTSLARQQAHGEDISGCGLDNDDLKRVPEFADGSKLSDLLHLYQSKVRKVFGDLVEGELLARAKRCRCELAREQRKGLMALWPALRPVLPMYALAVALMVFDACNGTIVFHSTKALLDKVGTGEVSVETLGSTMLQTYVKFIFCVFAHLSSWAFTHKVTADFRLKVRNEIMANMLRQDMKFFDRHSSGLLQERLNNDAEQLASKAFHLPLRLVDSICRLCSCAVVLYSFNTEMFYICVAPIPVIATSCHFIIRYMRKLGQRQRKIGEHVAANTVEVIKEIRTVREFGKENEEAEKFAASSSYRAEIEQYASAMHHIVLISPLCCLFEGMRFYCTYLGGTFVAGASMTPGQAVMAAGMAGDMTHMVRSIFDVLPELVSALQPLGRVCDMLAMRSTIEPFPGQAPKKKPTRFQGAIEFRNVNFTFPSEPLKQVLFDLSWSVSPGEKVGFVGGSNCGKSTSFYLLERWYQPQSGQILLDKEPIENFDVHHLRRHMSVVAQTVVLFSTTLRENIVYGLSELERSQVTDAQLEDVLRKANAWDFVCDFPRKLETYVGERGVKLSGGQRQRLAIARAIIREPSMLLLDEATSGLDSKCELLVQEAIDKITDEHRSGCTLMVAHRLSTLRSCDRIIVLDKGQVKETGSHAELMRSVVKKRDDGSMLSGWYRDLYETQHGKADDKQALLRAKSELADLKWKLAKLERENIELRRMDQILHQDGPEETADVALPTLLIRGNSDSPIMVNEYELPKLVRAISSGF
jgi:ABC-type multidrug transport system fused ATPase/permease subunit